MNDCMFPEFSLKLNDYKVSGSDRGLWSSGPDPEVCARIEERLRQLIKTGAGRLIMAQIFNREDRTRRRAARAKLKEFLGVPPSPGKEARKRKARAKRIKRTRKKLPATSAQKIYARRIGLAVPDNIRRDDIARRLIEFGLIRSTLRTAWKKMEGGGPLETAVPREELDALTLEVLADPQQHKDLFRLQRTEYELGTVWPRRAQALFSPRKFPDLLPIPGYFLGKIKKASEKKISSLLRRRWKKYRGKRGALKQDEQD